MTRRHSTLFTLRSGQSGLGFYTKQRDEADEFLNTELFTTVDEAQGLADRWPMQGISTLRLHSALQGRTPLEAAKAAAA